MTKLGSTGGKKRNDISKVYDEVGVMRQRKEAVEVASYNYKVLNEGGRSEFQGDGGGGEASGGNALLNEAMT